MNFSNRHKLHLLLALLYGLALAKMFHEIRGGGGYSITRGYWGCSAGWGRIFTTKLTIMGSQIFGFWGKKGIKMGRFSVKKSESCSLLNLTIGSH